MIMFSQNIFLDVPQVFGADGSNVVRLTDVEKNWLKAHPIIRLAPDPKFQPIEFFDDKGDYAGMGADYVRLIEKKLGIRFEIVKCPNWEDVISRIKRREVDVLNAVVKTPQRETYLTFPPPYLIIPSVIIVRKKVDRELSLDMLRGMHVVMVSGYGYVDLMHNKYPQIEIELVSDLKTALRKVSFGMADAFVGDLATASSSIESEGITNLKIAGETEPPNISGFAVRSDWPEFSRILEKGIALLTEKERKEIQHKWIHLESESGLTIREFRNVMMGVAVATLLIVFCFLFWTRTLRRAVRLRTEDLQKEVEERKQAEEALKESESHLRTLIRTIPDLVWLKDPKGVYLSCNPRFESFFGGKEKDIVGKTDYDFVDKKLADFFRENDQLAIDKGKPSRNEEEVTFADDGHLEILETIKTPMYRSDGQLAGVLGIGRNITERKRSEVEKSNLEEQLRQAQKMEALGTLAGGIAHDFNNILSAILGYTELALYETVGETSLNEYLSEVFTAGNRAKELVQQILTLSRHNAVEFKPIHINSVVKEAVKMLRSTIPTSINIQENICNKQLVVEADPTQIHQVIINLATNAKHAMSETGGVLVVDVDSVSFDESTENLNLTPGEYARITVSDTGTGINKEHLEKIFEPYFTTKAVGEGSGLGLSVVHGIVKSHKGDIKVYSEPGKGTTVPYLSAIV